MKKLIIHSAVASMLILLTITASAQQKGETRININFNIAKPTGSFTDYIDNTSGRAWNINLMYGINDRWAIGGEVGYRNFYQKNSRDVYKTSDGSDISAVLTNTVETIPLLANLRYNFLPGQKLQPYVSFGAGINFINISQYVGEFTNVNKNDIGFAAIPEAGIYVPFGKMKTVGLNLGASYSFMPYSYGSMDNLQHLAVQIGVSLPLRNR